MGNSVIDLLNARIASRAFSDEKLDESVIRELIEAARLTPSCFNKQPWRFLFLQSREALEKGRRALEGGNREWAVHAPLLIVAFSKEDDDCVLKDGRVYHEFDLGLSVMNIILAATQHNLIARPMAGFNPDVVKENLSLESNDEPMVMIAVGKRAEDDSHLPENYRNYDNRPRKRKSASEIAGII